MRCCYFSFCRTWTWGALSCCPRPGITSFWGRVSRGWERWIPRRIRPRHLQDNIFPEELYVKWVFIFIKDTTFHIPTSIWCTFEKLTKFSGKRHVRLVLRKPDHVKWPLIWKLSGDLRKPDTYVVIRVLSIRPCKLPFELEATFYTTM